MKTLRYIRPLRAATIALVALALVSCEDDETAPPTPVLTTINVSLQPSAIQMGQAVTAAAAGVDQEGDPIETGTVTWSSSSDAVATVDAAGVVTGVAAGTTNIVATAGGKTGQVSVTVNGHPGIRINEVESNGGTPGDWVELFNPTNAPIDLSGFKFRDNDATHAFYSIPAGATVAAGAYLVLEEAQFSFGLGGADEAGLYNPYGIVVEVYAWTAHAGVTYGRCANGSGDFVQNSVSTKGAANVCPATVAPWPGADDVTTVDATGTWTSNLSGLTYEGGVGGAPNVLWAALNGPGSVWRLTLQSGQWLPDPANNWGAGKLVHYTNGTGQPDSEGITMAGTSSGAGIYVASERDNNANTISRNVILRFDVSGAAAELTATHQWDITADLPVVGANLGLEAITYIPDAVLTARNFFDESKNRAYAPADYPDHAGGIFFVGVEGNGNIYAYALNHTNGTFTRIATFASGLTHATGSGIMDLAFDPATNYLWGACDDTCNGTLAIFEINTTTGRFGPARFYARPASMPNINNEGFTLTPVSECVNNRKPVFWSDDNDTGGNSLRRATINCGPIAGPGASRK